MLAELPADDATLIAPVDAAPAFQAQLAQALAPDAEAPPVAAGDRYGAWRLVRLLGEGGMGEVWLAERADGLYEAGPPSSCCVAMWPGRASRHASRANGRCWAVSATPASRGCWTRVSRTGAPSWCWSTWSARRRPSTCARRPGAQRPCAPAAGVARAVEHAHAQLIVHRDLKPSNVMVHESGTTKLLDFGNRRPVDDSGAQTDHQLDAAVGRRLTPAYAAPEQIRGGAIGIAGGCLFTGRDALRAGQRPPALWLGKRSSRTAWNTRCCCTQAPRITRFATGAEADPTAERPRPPGDAARARGDLEAVAAKAMRKEPGRRYASVGALIRPAALARPAAGQRAPRTGATAPTSGCGAMPRW